MGARPKSKPTLVVASGTTHPRSTGWYLRGGIFCIMRAQLAPARAPAPIEKLTARRK
jgi:hypothetical protein